MSRFPVSPTMNPSKVFDGPDPGPENPEKLARKLDFNFDYGDVDITVTVKGSIIHGRVCSVGMIRASPVWKNFIFPPFGLGYHDDGEGKDLCNSLAAPVQDISAYINRYNCDHAKLASIDFTEDDADTLHILLSIAHLEFFNVPETLTYTQLLNIALQCEQYQMANLVVPFLPQWLANEKTLYTNPQQGNWLFIACVFGRTELFDTISQSLLQELYTLPNGRRERTIITSGDSQTEDPTPANAVGDLLNLRERVIQDILEIPYNYMARLGNPTKINCKHGKYTCDRMAFQMIARQLRGSSNKQSLWPAIKPCDLKIELSILTQVIRSVRLDFSAHSEHHGCNVTSFAEAVDKVAKGCSIAVAQQRHMARVPRWGIWPNSLPPPPQPPSRSERNQDHRRGNQTVMQHGDSDEYYQSSPMQPVSDSAPPPQPFGLSRPRLGSHNSQMAYSLNVPPARRSPIQYVSPYKKVKRAEKANEKAKQDTKTVEKKNVAGAGDVDSDDDDEWWAQ